MSDTAEIAFLFIGGPHQVYHLAPVAAELSLGFPQFSVVCAYPDEETGNTLDEIRTALNASATKLEHVPPPDWCEMVARAFRHKSLRKGPLLYRLARRFRNASAIVTPERTSAALRWMGLRRKLLIHFRHGAGDRVPRSEKRLNAFDLIVVPGEKDLCRAIETWHIDSSRLRSCGYVKLDFLTRRERKIEPLFDNGRPVVVFNPHFRVTCSSWSWARRVIEAFRAQDRYNLVVAPHIRISDDMNDDELSAWKALEEEGRIIIDLRSRRLLDMSYTLAADIYLGDVSSQLYEFLVRPRPVVFLNTHDVEWEGDPRYRGWTLGEVVDSTEDLMPAIDRARERHMDTVEAQRAAVHQAYEAYRGASKRGAAIIVEALEASQRRFAPPSASAGGGVFIPATFRQS